MSAAAPAGTARRSRWGAELAPGAAGAGNGDRGGGGGGGSGAGSAASSFTRVTITVPSGLVGGVIGKGGETVRALQARSGATIQIQREADAAPGAPEREIYLSGDATAVALAKQRTCWL